VVGETANRKVRQPNPRNTRRSGPDLGALIDSIVVGTFGLVAVATRHDHWLKDSGEVVPITAPLKAWVDQLDAKTLKKFEKNIAPLLLTMGCVTVIGPDIIVEMNERAKSRNPQNVPVADGKGMRLYNSVVGSDDRGNPKTNGARGGDWFSSIPANAPIGSEFDV
jgi:hypothetical protein